MDRKLQRMNDVIFGAQLFKASTERETRTQTQRSGPPGRRPPGRTAVATGERPSREQIIRSIAGMSKEDLQWLVGEINQLIGGRR